MHAAPARYVSVSELYSADEVELLLDEIRELEPTSCQGEDVQDFEIAGSGVEGCGGPGGAGGRSPCGTELTERSWDSHAHYSRAPPPHPLHLAPVYCKLRYLLTLSGAVALIVALCSLCCCACVWSLVGAHSWLLPLGGRVRLLLLAGLTSAMMHGGVLLAQVSRLSVLLPVSWSRVSWLTCAWSSGSLLAGALAVLHAVLLAPQYRYSPPHVTAMLLSAAGLGLSGACAASIVVCVGAAACYEEHKRAAGAAGGGSSAHYRAVPSAPPPATASASCPHSPEHASHDPAAVTSAPQPSTSRGNVL